MKAARFADRINRFARTGKVVTVDGRMVKVAREHDGVLQIESWINPSKWETITPLFCADRGDRYEIQTTGDKRR